MPFEFILSERDADGIQTITVNRPDKLNALNRATIGELKSAFRECAAEPGVRALILTGAGPKAFIAGADINEVAESEGIRAIELAMYGQNVFRSLETMGKPSIAAINGYALGGGLELAMACTMRFAVPEAKLGQPEVKLGIVPGYGGTQRLPRLVGRGRALEMLLTGDPIDAAEAFRIGLVNRVVPREELIEASKTLLRRILANGPAAVRLTMQAVDLGSDTSLDAGQIFEAHAFGVAAATQDRREGTRAFLEKRQAKFTGQ